jgi:thymidylate synthase (FAD)
MQAQRPSGKGIPRPGAADPVTAAQQREIDEVRANSFATRRATVPALEEILYQPLAVLDRGFIRVVDYMGDDAAVVQAARVSYGKGTKQSRDDAGLINYLMRHWHTSPFEMCEIKLHVKLPIFVARQWIRHRTASVNEYSARYSILDNEFYMPEPEHLSAQSQANRQGRGDTLTGLEAERVLELLRTDAERAYRDYEELLNETADGRIIDRSRSGLARELARMNLTLNFYTQWYWKTDLHNLMHFIRLRADAHAQYEIRAYAEVLLGVLERWAPLTADAFRTYRMGGIHLSEKAIAVVRRLIAGERIEQAGSGLSPREWRELMDTLGR